MIFRGRITINDHVSYAVIINSDSDQRNSNNNKQIQKVKLIGQIHIGWMLVSIPPTGFDEWKESVYNFT